MVKNPCAWPTHILSPPVFLCSDQKQPFCILAGACTWGDSVAGEPAKVVIFLWLVIVVLYWCKWCLLPCPQHASILGNFGVIAAWLQSCQYTLYACVFKFQSIYAAKWPVLSTCMHLILFIWHVISMLCWMLSLSDSYPFKLWFLCVELHVCFKNHGWQNVYCIASNMYASNPVYMIYN